MFVNLFTSDVVSPNHDASIKYVYVHVHTLVQVLVEEAKHSETMNENSFCSWI